MCEIDKDVQIKSCRLKNRGQLKAFLAIRYKGHIAQRIVKFFDFRTAIDFDNFIDQIEVMMNQKNDNLFKMGFKIFDFDDDGVISELDLYAVLKVY